MCRNIASSGMHYALLITTILAPSHPALLLADQVSLPPELGHSFHKPRFHQITRVHSLVSQDAHVGTHILVDRA
jgi:hypothetical protein